MRSLAFLALPALATALWAQAPQVGGGTISTVAGTGGQLNACPNFIRDGIAGNQATLCFVVDTDPTQEQDVGHIAVDTKGNLYIADKGNQRIRKVDTSGIITTFAGTGQPGNGGSGNPATQTQLNFPTAVAADGAGNVYFTDEDNDQVKKIDTKGIVQLVAGAGSQVEGFGGDGQPATAAALNGPEAVAVDAAGNVYIADTFNNRVRMVSAKTGVITTIAGNGQHGDSNMQCDGAAATIPDSAPGASVCLGWPSGLLADNNGNLFISDYHNNVVRVLNLQTGTIRRLVGTGLHGDDAPLGDGGPPAQAVLGFPVGLAFDAAGNLYIADMHNDVIRRVTSPLAASATISTPVGAASNGFGGDNGPAWAAKLSRPTGLAIDANGNLYFADWYNDRVRKVTPGTNVPQPLIFANGVVNAGGFAPSPAPLAPGAIVSIFGQRLAPATAAATTLPLPTTLLDQKVTASVNAGGKTMPMPLFYVSADQINAQLPFEAPPGPATVAVQFGSVASGPAAFTIAQSAIGIFTYPNDPNRAVVQNQDLSLNSAANPAPRGTVITVYLTGVGPMSPPIATGQPASLTTLSQATLDKSAIIGPVEAPIQFLGATPGFVGLEQANIVVPGNASTGDQPLALHVGGQDSTNRPIVSVK
ncbi:MAG TPA: hypothetical protein VEU62_07095 [Bryobacterales bacterium]|nr:hypothetical protein [Bryobacterales bacterium]